MSKVELECPNCYSVVTIDQTHQACGCGYKFQISDQTIFLDKDERIAQELALYHSTGDGATLTEAVLARVASSILVTTEAALRGANAVVGTQFSYSQLSGKNTAMLMLAVCGTAVVIE